MTVDRDPSNSRCTVGTVGELLTDLLENNKVLPLKQKYVKMYIWPFSSNPLIKVWVIYNGIELSIQNLMFLGLRVAFIIVFFYFETALKQNFVQKNVGFGIIMDCRSRPNFELEVR